VRAEQADHVTQAALRPVLSCAARRAAHSCPVQRELEMLGFGNDIGSCLWFCNIAPGRPAARPACRWRRRSSGPRGSIMGACADWRRGW